MDLNTIFLISVVTARMIFPGLAPDSEAPKDQPTAPPASKSVSISILSNRTAPPSAKISIALPAGLQQSKSVRAAISRQKPQAAENSTDTILRYWGSSASILEGQPQVGPRKPETGDNAVPTATYAYWPVLSNFTLPKDASPEGVYTLSSNCCGGGSVTVEADQTFLAPLELANATQSYNFSKPLEIKWMNVPGALAYFVTAIGDAAGETVQWTSSSQSETPNNIEATPLSPETLKQYLEKQILLPAETPKCTIPSGIFKSSSMVMVSIVAIGRDKAEKKLGVESRVVVRSIASIGISNNQTPPGIFTN